MKYLKSKLTAEEELERGPMGNEAETCVQLRARK